VPGVPGVPATAPTGRPTPTRMRLVAAALVVLGALVGLAGAWSFSSADAALTRADDNAAQLVRLQELQTRLVSADANATNAFLVGGLEPADRRAVYDDAVTAAAELVAEAARAQPADGAVLAALNTAILDYTGGIEQARAANRQALPVGAQYLREASATLRADALPALAALTDANDDRVRTELAAAQLAWVLAVVATALGLVGVVAASVWLARRTHRVVNVRVAVGGLVLVVLLIASAVTLGSVSSQVGEVRDGPFAAASALSEARLGAYDAKANESLTLISRGSGQAFEDAWVASSDATVAALDTAAATGTVAPGLAEAWDEYAAQHRALRELDDGGAWEQAVTAATSDAEASPNAAFAAFDTASAAALDDASAQVSGALGDARGGLTLGAWLAAVAGLAVAVLSWTGFARRIEEYR
ncbi:hypothetical protein, partial [Actinotalea ferrariae]|uniref:hypothetical protein n=1 Tax=Actinotalea ferrariae TaxID=1386098 RepID=UPI001C8C5E2E